MCRFPKEKGKFQGGVASQEAGLFVVLLAGEPKWIEQI